MSSEDRKQTASFRGINFLTESHTAEVGRRVNVNEYPFSDQTTTEDLGRKSRTYTLTAYVIGDDHDLQRDKLIAALETKGPGQLVHPDYGHQTVVGSVHTVSSDRKQRITSFVLNFEQAGDVNKPSHTQVNVQAARNDSYHALSASLTQHFAHNIQGDS